MNFGKLRRNDFPVGLMVDIHDYCNASCKMCPYPSLKAGLSQGKMDWNLYMKIVDDFSTLIKRYEFRGMMAYCNMGEPFIENDLSKYTRYAEGKGVSVYLNTNGSLMTPAKIDPLIDSGFNGTFNISFHAASSDLYKDIMGLDIDRTKENIDYLLKKYQKNKIGFNVINYRWPEGEENEIRRLFQQWDMPLNITKPISRAGLTGDRKFFIRHIAGCGPERVLYQMVICHNGDVLLCCNDMSRKEVVGNLAQSTIQEVWNGAAFRNYMHEIYLGKRSSDDMICHSCEESVPYWSLRRFAKLVMPESILQLWRDKRKTKWGLARN